MMFKLVVLGLLFLGFTDPALAKTWVIKKGTHGSLRVSINLASSEEKIVKFNNSAKYKTKIEENQHDVNKLFGFNDCHSHHHKNSARFGWRWYNQKLEILSYTYVKGIRASKLLRSIDLFTSYHMKIDIDGSDYVFFIDGEELDRVRRGCSKDTIKYRLNPYFGGDEKAPQDIKIEMH